MRLDSLFRRQGALYETFQRQIYQANDFKNTNLIKLNRGLINYSLPSRANKTISRKI